MKIKNLLKRCTKKKVSYTLSMFTIFMITGMVAVADNNNPVTRAEFELLKINTVFGSDAVGTGAAAVAIGNSANATNDSSITIGNKAKSLEKGSISMGFKAYSDGFASTAIGDKASAKGDKSIAMGQEASAAAENSIALGSNSETKENYENTTAKYTNEINSDSTSGVLSIGNDNTKRRIVNVAGGVDSTDAVNVAQLDKVKNDITNDVSENTKTLKNHEKRIKNNEDDIKEFKKKIAKQSEIAAAETEAALKENTESINANKMAIKDLNNKVDHLDNKLNKAVSLMSAMSSVDFSNLKIGNVGVAAGVGSFSNSQGVAVGVAYAPNEDFTVNAKMGAVPGTAQYNTVSAGFMFQFNPSR